MTDSPSDTMQSLPETIEALRALVLATFAERDAAVTERDTLLTQNDRLRHLLLKLTRMHFGARSERLPEEQLQLGLEALEQAIAKDEAQAEKQDPELRKENATKRRASRGALPAHLPRVEVTLTPEDTACPCCRATMTMIGEDTSERLDVIPAQFRVIVTRRPKLACRTCPGSWPLRLAAAASSDATRSVAIRPGTTTLTVMPSSTSSFDRPDDHASSAALAGP